MEPQKDHDDGKKIRWDQKLCVCLQNVSDGNNMRWDENVFKIFSKIFQCFCE